MDISGDRISDPDQIINIEKMQAKVKIRSTLDILVHSRPK
jgi:hypothetical protein